MADAHAASPPPLPEPLPLPVEPWPDYEYLDSGDGRRLERFAGVLLDRPAPQAIWPRHLADSEWDAAAARYLRHSDGSGDWIYRKGELRPWTLRWRDVRFELRPTGFGHLGIFAEQGANWPWIQEQMQRGDQQRSLLNLFAYTGGTTLAAAAAGARVTHLDAVKGVVQWASENARRSGLGEAPVRWIVDDVLKFAKRELRRERRYDAIVMDPPSFGRGRQGQVWKLEDDLATLLEQCDDLLTEDACCLLVTAHTPGITPAVLANLLEPIQRARGGRIASGEMVLRSDVSARTLPSGVHARWWSEGE